MNETTHVALPLKYRPMTFEDVVGQEHVTRTLRNALTSGRIANAYLFVGPRGIGKTTLSRIFAKALNCTQPNGVEPCGTCTNCIEIAGGHSIDVTELDAASHNGVEDARELMSHVNFPPTSGKYKIFIIDECHMLSTAAWNALLKTLEEPPKYVKFIFATTESDKLLATIISRCQRFDLRRIGTDQIVSRLEYICKKEGVTAASDALLAIARGAEGGMRDALSSLDQLIAFKGDRIEENDALSVFGLVSREALEGLSEAILKGDAPSILRAVAEFDSAGKNMRRLAAELLTHFRNLLVASVQGGKTTGIEATADQQKVIARQAVMCPTSRLFTIADLLSGMEDKLRYALNVKTLLEMTLLKASRVATTASIEELMRAVRELKSQIVAGGVTLQAVVPEAMAASAPSAPSPAPVASAPAKQAPAAPPPPSPPPAPRPKPVETRPQLSREERQQVVDDPKVRDLMGMFSGSKIMDVK